MTGALNPVFSPDGSAVLFTAVANNERDLYYWVIGAATPTNITAAFPNTRNEDPKFSPDGTKIVWKQTFSIEQANLVFNGSGTPSLTGAVQLVLGHQGMSDEASAPVYSPTQKYIYYYTGTGSGAQVQQYNTQTATHGPAFTMQPNTEYYYPVDPDYYEFFYTSWLTPTNTFDKIYLYSRVTQTADRVQSHRLRREQFRSRARGRGLLPLLARRQPERQPLRALSRSALDRQCLAAAVPDQRQFRQFPRRQLHQCKTVEPQVDSRGAPAPREFSS